MVPAIRPTSFQAVQFACDRSKRTAVYHFRSSFHSDDGGRKAITIVAVRDPAGVSSTPTLVRAPNPQDLTGR